MKFVESCILLDRICCEIQLLLLHVKSLEIKYYFFGHSFQLNDNFQKQQMEKEAGERHIEELDATIQQADLEKDKVQEQRITS